jgi:NAD(P)-dependent dehydrogenase (short-subunit alcohol dehydrogenase family)
MAAWEGLMADLFGYNGKRVIVSGCFSGMGEATARLLLSLGAEVHGLDYKDCALGLTSFHRTDLRDPASIDAAVAAIGGRVDALFNCAGLPQTCPPLDVMKVNFIGTRHLTDRVIPLMPEGGAIASISSTGGLGWSRRMPVLMELIRAGTFAEAASWAEQHAEIVREGYALSKEAVIVWTMMTSSRLIKRGIRINCTAPGPTQTPMMKEFESATPKAILTMAMQPIDRLSTPEEQAGPLVFLNSPAATYVTGVLLPVDGGFMGGMATGQIEMAALSAAAAA